LTKKAREKGKPVFCWLIGEEAAAKTYQMETQDSGIPVYREIFRAIECMNAVFVHGRQAALQEQSLVNGDDLKSITPDAVEHLLKDRSGVLDEYDSKVVLEVCNIPVTREHVVASSEAACDLAVSRIPFPVVMKGLVPDSVHKTEAGLVKLNLTSTSQVKAAFEDLKQGMDGRGKILIQEQIMGELELIAGMVRDPQFGPCVMVGLGGVMAEVLDDAVFGVASLTHEDALGLLDRLKHQSLLDGFRGAVAVDRDTLANSLSALGQLAMDYPQVKEIDVNPLIISQGKPIAVDASIILD
jgi:acyl-CoA synthetase (NDP forming)